MQCEIAVTIEDITYVCERIKVVFHTFHCYHSLFVVIDSQCLILYTFGSNLNAREVFNLYK